MPPVARARAFHAIVERVRDEVFSQRRRAGDRLPSEQQLAAQFGVSRPGVREALRVLELQGLIEVRHGYGGGVFIATPGATPIRGALEVFLRLGRVDTAELYQARGLFEPAMARLALEADAPALLTRLTANLERSQAAIEAGDSVSAINREFHLIIAEQAGNRVLALFMQAVDELLESLDREFPHPPATSLCASQDHRQMLAAVADGDVERLEQRMRAHLARLESSHRGGRETLGDGSPRALRSPESASGSPESASLAQDAALTAPATVR